MQAFTKLYSAWRIILAVLWITSVNGQNLPTAVSTIFMGSGKCAVCHQPGTPNTNALLDRLGRDVSPPTFWRSTMMANASKEIFWQAKVTAEVTANPHLQAVIEDKCTTCHAPMGRTEAIHNGATAFSFAEMKKDTLSMDGVSCTVCHQIKEDNLGTPESFSGHYFIENDRIIYGPFKGPITNPMQNDVNYTPQYGQQITGSEMCATCHTLFTPYVDNNGNVVGTAPEQTPYQEWQNSIYPSKDVECQTCHLPALEEAVIISNRPMTASARSPYALHNFTGGNVYMLNMLKKYGQELGVTATSQHFDSTIARTLRFLRQQTVDLTASYQWKTDDTLEIQLAVQNKTGHKFPTGYPSRRAWVELNLQDEQGAVAFESGAWDASNGDIAGLDENYEPHHTIITSPDQIQIYQSVMKDVDGKVTYTLLRAAGYIKDNRIPPVGFVKNGVAYDTTEIIGLAEADPDFNANASGCDTVIYRIGGLDRTKTYHLIVRLNYQSLSPRFVNDLLRYDTPEVNQFREYYQALPNLPVTIDSLSLHITPTGLVENRTYLPNSLLQVNAFPNPFNPNITIALQLKQPGKVTVTIFNIAGQKVKTFNEQFLPGGNTFLHWNAQSDANSALPSGEYLVKVRFQSSNGAQTAETVKKIIFIK